MCALFFDTGHLRLDEALLEVLLAGICATDLEIVCSCT